MTEEQLELIDLYAMKIYVNGQLGLPIIKFQDWLNTQEGEYD